MRDHVWGIGREERADEVVGSREGLGGVDGDAPVVVGKGTLG